MSVELVVCKGLLVCGKAVVVVGTKLGPNLLPAMALYGPIPYGSENPCNMYGMPPGGGIEKGSCGLNCWLNCIGFIALGGINGLGWYGLYAPCCWGW